MDKPKIIAAGGLIVNEKQELLMIFRRGHWDLPKGKWDDGETIEQCALREVREETGIADVQLGALIGLTYHEYFNTYTNQDVVKETHWYAMTVDSSVKLVPQTEEDIEKIEWVPFANIGEKMQQTYPNILEILHKANLS